MTVNELRIHGVHNTPPADMLGLAPEEIEPLPGGNPKAGMGFWRAKLPQLPPGLSSREAYSWGNMTSGEKSDDRTRAGLFRALWLLLLPFAFTNVAYWARQDLQPTDERRGRAWTGAVIFRLAALLQTALLVTTVSQIAIDEYGWQCLGRAECLNVPLTGFLRAGAGAQPARRIAAAAIVPILLVALMWVLSRKSVQRYEGHSALPEPRDSRHILELPALWSGKERVLRLQRLHLATGLFVVIGFITWPVANLGSGTDPTGVLYAEFIGAMVGVVIAVALTVIQTSDGPEFCVPPAPTLSDRVSRGLAVFSMALTAASVITVAAPTMTFRETPASLSAAGGSVGGTPLVLINCLCALVFISYALKWVPRLNEKLVWLLTALGLGAVGGVAGYLPASSRALVVGIGAAVVAALWLAGMWSQRHSSATTPFVAWGGAPHSLLLGAGVLTSLLYSTTATLISANVLGQKWRASSLIPLAPRNSADIVSTDLAVPPVYLWLAAMLLVLAVVLVVVVVISFVGFRRTPVWKRLPDTIAKEYAGDADDMVRRETIPQVSTTARRAAYAHRGERLLGVCAAAVALPALLALVGSLSATTPWEVRPFGHALPFAQAFTSIGVYVAGLTGFGVIALGGLAYRSAVSRRTVGIIWDLCCFWPRAAHPFSPPCYAERAVPDLHFRTAWRIDEGENVILSGHSLGSTLAVATYFRLDPAQRKSVSLITYGSQLRAFFGRIFPAIFGPEILGNAPLDREPLWSDGQEQTATHSAGGNTLAAELQAGTSNGRWRNLVRRTDFIGFRAFDDVDPNSVDFYVRATPKPVAGNPETPLVMTHSDYPNTIEYERHLSELIAQSAPRPQSAAKLKASRMH